MIGRCNDANLVGSGISIGMFLLYKKLLGYFYVGLALIMLIKSISNAGEVKTGTSEYCKV